MKDTTRLELQPGSEPLLEEILVPVVCDLAVRNIRKLVAIGQIVDYDNIRR